MPIYSENNWDTKAGRKLKKKDCVLEIQDLEIIKEDRNSNADNVNKLFCNKEQNYNYFKMDM